MVAPSQSAPPYRIVPFSIQHQDLVANLQRHLWSMNVRLNLDYLDWKYHRNPYIQEPLIYLAFCRDELVGMRGVLGARWEIGDAAETLALPYPDDLVVDPSHRQRGLHRLIMEFAMADLSRRGYRYVVNLSASRVTAHASINMRWRRAGSVEPFHRRTPGNRLIDAIEKSIRNWKFIWRWPDTLSSIFLPSGERLFERLDTRFSASNRSRQSPLFLKKAPLVHEMAQLVRRLPKDGRIRHVRDETYLAWRFANPLSSYRFLYAGGEELDGYLVLQRSLGPDRWRVKIVDWEAISDQVRFDLIAAAVDGYFPELLGWTVGAPPVATQMLERFKFARVQANYETGILIRSIRNEELDGDWMLGGRRLDYARDWDLRMIYSMQG